MKNKLTKYGLMTIAAMLLVAMAFAGAASAVQITADQWNSMTTSAQINGNEAYEFTGPGIIYPKFNGTIGYDVNRSITFDFTNYTGTFYGEPSASSSKKGALFGNITNETFSGTITIKNLTLTSVNVLPTGYYQYFGGIVGFFCGKSTDDSNLNITNCTVVNCSIGSFSGQNNVGSLVGYAKNTNIYVCDCKAKFCDIRAQYTSVGGLVGHITSASFVRCNVTNSRIAASGGEYVGGLVGNAQDGFAGFEMCGVENISVFGGGRYIGGLVGYSGLADKIEDCIVNNSLIASSSGHVGGVIGYQKDGSPGTNIANCHVVNCTISAGSNVGGLIGRTGSACLNLSDNDVKNCAVKGNSDVNLVCGDKPEMENPSNCTVSGENYIQKTSVTIPQPQISTYKNTAEPRSDLKTAITVTKIFRFGTQTNWQYGWGYVIDSSLLEFNPLNGTDTYSTIIKVGAKDTFAVPADTGYIFNGWNISSADGTKLTNAAGELLSGVTGYTNATGYWNNVSGITVALYANRTAIEYNNSVTGGVATFGNGLPVAQVNVGSANPNITDVSFKFMGAPADIATKPSGYKSIATINDAFNLSITGTQDADVTVVFNATGSGTIFLAHNKTGNWEFLKATSTGVAGQYKAVVTKESGFSPFQVISAVANDPVYTPSSSKQTGSTVILSEGQVAPTASATVAPTVAPTVKPTEQPATPTVIATEKPTTQATQQSPAPFVGLLAGLGAAAVLLRMRK